MPDQPKPLIPCHCHKCGAIGESNLTWAGPHIKQTCPECNSYQKFYDKVAIPDVREIKILIFGICNGNFPFIRELKQSIQFVDGLAGLDAKLQYYKLYKAAMEWEKQQTIKSKTNPSSGQSGIR